MVDGYRSGCRSRRSGASFFCVRMDMLDEKADMNRKLHRVLDEIQKTEEKITAWQGYLGELKCTKRGIGRCGDHKERPIHVAREQGITGGPGRDTGWDGLFGMMLSTPLPAVVYLNPSQPVRTVRKENPPLEDW